MIALILFVFQGRERVATTDFFGVNNTAKFTDATNKALPEGTTSGSSPQMQGDEQHGPQLAREQYLAELAHLHVLVSENNIEGLSSAGEDIERKWGPGGGDIYAHLMIQLSSLISNGFPGEGGFSLSQKFTLLALKRADTFSVQTETFLLPYLARDIAPRGSDEWAKERSLKTQQWLHAWHRIEKDIDRNFNFDDRPMMYVSPPPETGMRAGVDPKAISDPIARSKYQAAINANEEKSRRSNQQVELWGLVDPFTKETEQYLLRVYSEPPYDLAELSQLLTAYNVNEDAKKRLLSEAAIRISQVQQ